MLSWFIKNLAITLAIYAAFPMLFALLWRREIKINSYRIWSFVVNFIIAAALFVMQGGGAMNATPCILWTIVFTSLGKRVLDKRGFLLGW